MKKNCGIGISIGVSWAYSGIYKDIQGGGLEKQGEGIDEVTALLFVVCH